MTEPKTAAMFGSKPGNGRVLLIEDDPGICKEMRTTLETAGFDVLEADTEDRAIGMAREGENPLLLDVVITDVDKKLGVGSLNYFKSQFPHIPLIALTGMIDQESSGSSTIRIGVVGAGRGGRALLDVFLHLPDIQVVGVTDKNPGATGLQFAQEFEIPVVPEPMNLIRNEHVDLLIDVTGDPAMERLIAENKQERTQVLSGAASKLLWLLVQREREIQSYVLRSEKLAGMIRDGVKDFLMKPIGKDRLVKAVSSAVEQHELSRL
ncbi:MAG: response regulator [Nitrospira sp. SB0677_bin_15]|nr:response regulator [Nitrospira sp. SB0677_bin_15]MYH01893.1 response regulator [Nitrospira sp. SB0675_bin_23]MYJ22705.1 response regulator [Nitrospira sp. SB0673_bin_12]